MGKKKKEKERKKKKKLKYFAINIGDLAY